MAFKGASQFLSRGASLGGRGEGWALERVRGSATPRGKEAKVSSLKLPTSAMRAAERLVPSPERLPAAARGPARAKVHAQLDALERRDRAAVKRASAGHLLESVKAFYAKLRSQLGGTRRGSATTPLVPRTARSAPKTLARADVEAKIRPRIIRGTQLLTATASQFPDRASAQPQGGGPARETFFAGRTTPPPVGDLVHELRLRHVSANATAVAAQLRKLGVVVRRASDKVGLIEARRYLRMRLADG